LDFVGEGVQGIQDVWNLAGKCREFVEGAFNLVMISGYLLIEQEVFFFQRGHLILWGPFWEGQGHHHGWVQWLGLVSVLAILHLQMVMCHHCVQRQVGT